MAEDSLLLNFAQGDATFAAKRSFSGGRWRDRLTAKKAASNWQKKLASNAPNKGTAREPFQGDGNPTGPDSNLDTRAAKRQRIEGLPRPQDHGYVGKKQRGANSNAFKPDQFVSSLFTSNPSPQALAEERGQVDEEAPVEPSNAPLSSELESFTSLGLSTILASHLLNKLEIKAPTAIQKEAIGQLVKEDSDAFVQAETGSGKTLAYLLPIVQRLVSLSLSDSAHSDAQESSRIHRDSGLFAVVLAPTRELCKQILVVLESLLRCAHWIVPGAVTGGESKKKEKARLRKGINILVATPGRLADHLANTQVLDVSRVRWLVLDEGDRLVELGFENDIQKIVSNLNMQAKKVQPLSVSGLPEKRTTVLCSATMKMDVQRLGRISLKSPAHIQASTDHSHADENHASPENEFSAPSQLKQSYAIVPAKQRLVSLVAVLKRAFTRKGSVMKTMIFFTCADSVDFHFDLVAHNRKRQQGISGSGDEQPPPPEDTKMSVHNPQTVTDAPMLSSPANAVRIFRLHGSLHQSLRTSTLAAYAKSSEPAVLFCTDVASRGLDLPNVDFVIEYDPAFSKDDHLHRIGRTARAGRDGRALIFLTPGDEEGYVQILKQGRRDGGLGVARHTADELLQKGFGDPTKGANQKSREWEDAATEWQLNVERWVQDSTKNLEMARRAFQSHVRAYATHIAAERQIFNIKELHLGHLAKAFALRDKPGSIRVPGLRPGKDESAKTKAERRAKVGLKGSEDGPMQGKDRKDSAANAIETSRPTDAQEAARKMREKMKQMAGVSEFNIG